MRYSSIACSENHVILASAVLSQYTRVIDRQTDRQTTHLAVAERSAEVKITIRQLAGMLLIRRPNGKWQLCTEDQFLRQLLRHAHRNLSYVTMTSALTSL